MIGHSQGGKTMLIHELATRLAAASVRVIACDLDAAPGLWPGCTVYGYANDLAAINQALVVLRAEVERRRTLRGTDRQRSFPPLYLVIDEYQDVGRAAACPFARPLVEDVLRRGGKLNIHLLIGVQDKQVKTMGFEGQGEMRRNFTAVVAVRADGDGRRWATLTDPNEESPGATYGVPTLPNLDRLVEAAAHNRPVATGSACPTPITGHRLAENWPGEFPATETRFPASERDFTVSDGDFSVAEIAQIAAQIARGGKGKTEVVQAMPRYSGRKHSAYAACYERIRASIDTTQYEPTSS